MKLQVRTWPVSTATIMQDPQFARGFEDVRNGRPFDWRIGSDDVDDAWNYERGRAFAFIAPLTMPLKINGKLNPKAVALAEAAFDKRLIV